MVCSYEQQEENIICILNLNATNHIEWRVWSCASNYDEGLDFLFITIILSHTLEIETNKKSTLKWFNFFHRTERVAPGSKWIS